MYNLKRQLTVMSVPGTLQDDIRVFVRLNVSSRVEEIAALSTNTVAELKELINDKIQIPSDQQHLILQGKILEDGHMLWECGVGDGSEVNMVLRLRGGELPRQRQL